MNPQHFRLNRLAPLGCLLLLGLIGCASHPKTASAPSVRQLSSDKYQQAMQQASQAQLAGQGDSGKDYLIGPNDIIEIKVYEQDSMNTTARVAGDGTIRFPVLGILKVGGMNERQLEALLQDKLRGKYLQEPHVSVFVKETHAREVAIVGQVKSPGLYPIYGKMTLIELISKAGGLADAAGDTAYIIRAKSGQDSPSSATLAQGLAGAAKQNPQNERVDLKGLLLRGEEQWNVPLYMGDCVSIPNAGYVHVTGQGVVKPGTFELKDAPNTLSQFIDEAEGLKYSASKKMLLIRKTDNGQDLIIPVNYNKVIADHSKDIRLQSGDTVVVNRTPVKTALAATGNAISSVFRASIYYNFAPSTN